ncbi:hypothetical protein BDF19DRAFT_151250 [Syncephalis fuscata]|nr:hypothetical protein BDF19DRAFT_151250 [Syncephalis fuscata]
MLASTSNTSNMSAKSFKRAMTDIFRRRASSQLDLTIAEDADTQPILLDASNELATEENNSSALINAVNEDTSTLDIDTFNAQLLRLSNESTDVVVAEADTSMLLEDEQTVKSDKQSGQKARFKQAGRQMRRLTKKFADGELLTLRNKLRTNRSSNETNTANLTKMGKDGEKATDTGYAIEEDIEENNNLIVEAEEENTNEEEHHVDSVLNSPTEQNIVAKETTITCKVVSNSENNDLVNDSPVSTEEDYNAVLPADNAVEDSKTPTEDADVTLNSKVGICTEETDASTASEILDALDITATDPISALPELTEDETGEKDIEESTKDNAADFYILEESQEPFAFVDGAQPVDDNDDGYDEQQ